MKRAADIEKLIEKINVVPGGEMNRRTLGDALEAQKESDGARPATTGADLWRQIMKSRITRVTIAAAVVIVLFCLTVLDGTSQRAWAIGQTVAALDEIESVVISGTDRYGSESIPFKFWFRISDQNSGSFDMRYECDKQTVVVRGTKAWAYWSDENTVKIYEDVKTSDGMMRDLQFWYKIAQLSPWITGKMLATLELFADDWQETYGKSERTGQDCVFVTCSYEALSMSFCFVCDLESKLIMEGKYWRNSDREGPPECHAVSFEYNVKMSDATFDFQIPDGAKVIERGEQEEADALFNRGEQLFQQKRTAEAMEVYGQVYEEYPNLKVAESALMMIGVCYDRMGQHEKAIEVYEKCLAEYPKVRGWVEATYFYLGLAYMKTGQKDKAVEAFKNCVIMGEGARGPDKFPVKDAREYLRKLEKRK